MTECPRCEYNKKRAQNWREEAYRLAGHPLPRKETMIEDDDDIQEYKKPWVGLTDEEIKDIVRNMPYEPDQDDIRAIEAKLKEKNT